MIIENCKNCSVYTQQHIHLFDASVEITEDSIILFFPEFENPALPIPKTALQSFQFDAHITFFTPEKGAVTCNCHLVAQRTACPKDDKIYKAQCEIIKIDNVTDRRIDFKVKSNLSVSLSIPTEQGIITATGKVRDISAGGIYLLCKKNLQLNNLFEITFKDKNLPLTLHASALRKNELENGIFGYGCKFDSLRSGEERILRRYVFHQQRNSVLK